MKTSARFRMATPEDAPIVSDILRQSFAEYQALYTAEGFAATTPEPAQILTRMQEGPIWVAYREAEAVASGGAVLMGDSVYIRGMAVLPAARTIGVGRDLLAHIECWALAQGCSRLFLSTTPFLHTAIRMYERFGFRQNDAGSRDLFGTPLFTMEKRIVRT